MAKKRDLASAVHGAARGQGKIGPTAELPSPSTRGEPGLPSDAEPRGYRPPSRVGTKCIAIHVEPALSKSVRQLALDEDTTVQALGVEAIELLLASRGRAS